MGLFDCDCACAKPPDYTETAEANEYAADMAYKTAAEDLDFRKGVYEESLPRQRELQELAAQVAQQQLNIGDINQQRADEQWQNYLSTFSPQERFMAADALGQQYLSEEDRARMIELMQPVDQQPIGMQTNLDRTYENIIPATYGMTREDIPDSEVASDAPAKKINPVNTPNDGLRNAEWRARYGDMYNDDGTLRDEIYQQYYTREVQQELTPEIIENLPYYTDQQKAQLKAEYAQRVADYRAQQQAREQELLQLSSRGEQAMENKIISDADTLQSDMAARATEYYDREYGRAMDDELRARQQNEAAINSSYGMQSRELARRGFNPARIAQAASRLANDQALARIGANNQMYGLTAQRLRGADDTASNMRYAGEDQARNMRFGAKEQAANKHSALRAGAAAFGRNMPNTAGQAYGLAMNAGNSAVGNQSTGFQAGLPYANLVGQGYATGMQAAGIQQQGALGMANILSRDYATAQGAYNAQSGDGGLGALFGAGVQLATNWPSDRRLKEDIDLLCTVNGVNWYRFRFKDPDKYGHGVQTGVMADEIEKILPEAVTVGDDGYKRVNYAMVGEI
jgi:hypothetical protein